MRALAGAIGAAAVFVAGAIAGASETNQHQARRPTARISASTTSSPPGQLPAQLPSDRGQLAADLNHAQALIDDPSSSSQLLARAGWFEQLATVYLHNQRRSAQRATLAMLSTQAARSMHANLAAAGVLSRLVTPRKRLPPWKVIAPPAPGTLLGYFKAAQARFAVSWEYLAAIEFIETKFGRVHGTSTAGAQGPMQFMPATWAAYGTGSIDNPRDAIIAAARYLRASGAPADMAGALYHYNPSVDYVDAVNDYAGLMRADPRAYYGYYNWQVLYDYARGLVLLPVGYPKAGAVRVG